MKLLTIFRLTITAEPRKYHVACHMMNSDMSWYRKMVGVDERAKTGRKLEWVATGNSGRVCSGWAYFNMGSYGTTPFEALN